MSAVQQSESRSIKDDVAAFKRTRIINEAVELFYDRGYEHTTLDMVAERLGVTKPFIYAQFRSKAELLGEISATSIASALAELENTLELKMEPIEKLRLLAKRFAAAVLSTRMHIAIFTREEKSLLPEDFDRINVMRRTFDQKLTAFLREGNDSGDFAIADAHIAALSIGGMVSWAYVWYRPTGRLSIEEVSDLMSDLIVSMASPG